MNLSDQELTLYAIRGSQLILAHADIGAERGPIETLQELRDLRNRDAVEAVYQLEARTGLPLA